MPADQPPDSHLSRRRPARRRDPERHRSGHQPASAHLPRGVPRSGLVVGRPDRRTGRRGRRRRRGLAHRATPQLARLTHAARWECGHTPRLPPRPPLRANLRLDPCQPQPRHPGLDDAGKPHPHHLPGPARGM